MKKLIKRRDNHYILEHELPIIIFSSYDNILDIYENKKPLAHLKKDQIIFTKSLGQSEYEVLLDLIENFVNIFDGKQFIVNEGLFEFHKGRGLTVSATYDYFYHPKRLREIGQKYSKMSNIIISIINVYEKTD